jgi:hypothetical protein
VQQNKTGVEVLIKAIGSDGAQKFVGATADGELGVDDAEGVDAGPLGNGRCCCCCCCCCCYRSIVAFVVVVVTLLIHASTGDALVFLFPFNTPQSITRVVLSQFELDERARLEWSDDADALFAFDSAAAVVGSLRISEVVTDTSAGRLLFVCLFVCFM